VEVEGLSLRGAFDLVTALEQLLPGDCADLEAAPRGGIPEGSIVLGDASRVVIRGASVEPGVVFDVRRGSVVLDAGAEVRHGTRLEGPVYAGPGTRVLGGFIRGSSFGPECRVHGEIAATVFLGYANKSHDGFIGHSVVGQWVNLGAGTTTSNLKNTYGTVQLWTPRGLRDTGLQFFGTAFGDHVKTGIGLRLSTGTVLGAGANVFDAMPSKVVPPFAWGARPPYDTYDAGKFVQVVAKAMARRHVTLGEKARRQLLRAHAARWSA
jgi:UDP-N-acetylglucosamine diphosphorylase/glucosamine-1-phosphate N-acetyltransferase